MKKEVMAVVFIAMALALISSASAANINSCQTISVPGTYDLTANLATSGTCFKITASNVVLDCHGNKITRTGGIGAVIDVKGETVTIKNCKINITDPLQGSSGIMIQEGKRDCIMDNNEITLTGKSGENKGWDYGIWNLGVFTVIRNNKIYANGIMDGGIIVRAISVSGSSIYSNTIEVNYPSADGSASGEAIRIESERNYVGSNDIKVMGNQGFGVFVYGPKALNNRIEGNTIKVLDEAGIALHSLSFHGAYLPENTIKNNKILASSGSYGKAMGIYVYSCPDNYNILENTITTQDDYGIHAEHSKNIIIEKNAISTTAVSAAGISLYNSTSCSITKNNVGEITEEGVLLTESSHNNVTGNNLSNNVNGILVAQYSNYNMIANNMANSNEYSNIRIDMDSSYNSLINNTADNGEFLGIAILNRAHNNIIKGNTANNNELGIVVYSDANNNILEENRANYNNKQGIDIDSSGAHNAFQLNTACFNNQAEAAYKDVNDQSDSGFIEQTCETSNKDICYLKCAKQSYCCSVTANVWDHPEETRTIEGWFDMECGKVQDLWQKSRIEEHLIIESECENICPVSKVYAKFTQELEVPEDKNTSVNWIANYLPNTANTVTQDTEIVTNSSDILSMANITAITQGISPYKAMFPSQEHMEEYIYSKYNRLGAAGTESEIQRGIEETLQEVGIDVSSFSGGLPVFRGPYISVWDASLQKEVYNTAWGMEETDIPEKTPYLEAMHPYMPYFMSPDIDANVTWVGSVPQHATVELKKVSATQRDNYIILPLDTEIKTAKELCQITDENGTRIMTGEDQIWYWDVSTQKEIPLPQCKYNPTIPLEPGVPYKIIITNPNSWEQK